MDERLPRDHINVKKGREYLEKEQNRSLVQLEVMAGATSELALKGQTQGVALIVLHNLSAE